MGFDLFRFRMIDTVRELFGISSHVVKFRFTVSILYVRPVGSSDQMVTTSKAINGIVDLSMRLIEEWSKALALNVVRDVESIEFGQRGIQVNLLGQAVRYPRFFAGDRHDDWNSRGLFMQTHFLPEIMLTQMVAVITRKDHNGIFIQFQLFKPDLKSVRPEHP